MEVYTGDFSKKVKDKPGVRSMLETIDVHYFIDEIVREIQKAFVDYFRKVMLEPKDDSIEGQIIKATDTIDVLFEAVDEIKLGNNEFIPIFSDTMANLINMEFESIYYFLSRNIYDFGFNLSTAMGQEVYNRFRCLEQI